jgi:hypothetical protein
VATTPIVDGPQPNAADYELGLYLCLDFGVYTSYKLADDGMTVGNVGVSESIIRIKRSRIRLGKPKPVSASVNSCSAGTYGISPTGDA